MADDNLFSGYARDDQVLRPLCGYAELLKKLVEDLCDLLRSVLVDDVADLVHDDQFKFTLHLCDSKFFIHAITSRQEKLLGYSHVQETLGQTLEPALPIGFRGHQICSPYVLSVPLRIYLADDLMRHGNACAVNIFDSPGFDAILYDTSE